MRVKVKVKVLRNNWKTTEETVKFHVCSYDEIDKSLVRVLNDPSIVSIHIQEITTKGRDQGGHYDTGRTRQG